MSQIDNSCQLCGGNFPLDGKLEPETAPMRDDAALYSIAISLKRIADTLGGTAAGLCVTETLLGGRRAQ